MRSIVDYKQMQSSLDKTTAFLGFGDNISTSLWLFFSLATCGVILARSPLLAEWGMKAMAPPGEEFSLRGVRGTFVAHLALLIPWSILGVFQFVPVVRKSLSYRYHRMAGVIFLGLTAAVAATGLAMASNAFGGGFTSQVGMFVLFLSVILAAFNGYRAIRMKNIPAHRDWMIRLFAYAISVLTLRLFMVLGMLIASAIGGQYTTTRCDVAVELLANDVASRLPACSGQPGDTVVSILVSMHSAANAMAGLRLGYEASLVLSLLVHIALAELWIRTRYYTRNQDQAAIGVETATELNSLVASHLKPTGAGTVEP